MAGILTALGPLVDLGKWVAGEVSSWSKRRDALKEAKLEAQLAEIRAKAEIAAYKVKADVEWDLKWADQASTSWKDEFMLVLWAVPLIGLFIPGMRPFVMEGFEFLKMFHESAPQWYMAGWAIIFAATFGFKKAASLMLPGKVSTLVGALGSVEDDIPEVIIEEVHDRIVRDRGGETLQERERGGR